MWLESGTGCACSIRGRPRRPSQGGRIAPDQAYRLGTLGDVIELIVDGWAVEHLSYADRSGLGGSSGPPAAFIALRRGTEREFRYVPEDGRGYSHRALVSLLRERPHVWKHRSPEAAASAVGDLGPAEGWADVQEPFPESVGLGPAHLLGVVAVNQSQAIGDMTIALTSLERFETGARLRVLIQDGGLERQADPCMLDVVVVDDRGRIYSAAPSQSTRGVGLVEGEIIIGPAPPRDVGRVTVAVGSVCDGHDGGAPVEGPWVFPIELGPSA